MDISYFVPRVVRVILFLHLFLTQVTDAGDKEDHVEINGVVYKAGDFVYITPKLVIRWFKLWNR